MAPEVGLPHVPIVVKVVPFVAKERILKLRKVDTEPPPTEEVKNRK